MKLAFINNLINILTGGNNLNEEALGTAKIIFFFCQTIRQCKWGYSSSTMWEKVRNQRSRTVNPTAMQFRESFKSLMILDFCGSKSIGTNCETTNIPDLFNIKGLVDNINNNDYNSNDILSSYQIFNVNKYISKLSTFDLEKKIT
jgi:hypothetical protein